MIRNGTFWSALLALAVLAGVAILVILRDEGML